MNLYVFIASTLNLLTILVSYWIIPTFVPIDKQVSVRYWLPVATSSIFLILSITSSSSISTSFLLISLLAVFVLSGVFWWIPTYVNKSDQDTAQHWLIISSSIVLTIANIFFYESLGASPTTLVSTFGQFGARR
jgi:hypothetical protein